MIPIGYACLGEVVERSSVLGNRWRGKKLPIFWLPGYAVRSSGFMKPGSNCIDLNQLKGSVFRVQCSGFSRDILNPEL